MFQWFFFNELLKENGEFSFCEMAIDKLILCKYISFIGL